MLKGWFRPAASALLAFVFLYYLAVTLILLPDKVAHYGAGAGAAVMVMLTICAVDHAHHICKGVAAAVYMAGRAFVALGTNLCRLADGLAAFPDKVLETMNAWLENAHRVFTDWRRGAQ